ncbi:uncharacterized protein FOMMEDRAFT_154425 [Fomitiporia mediterranea MF3/22]|uniref:uncharacterized protein n=1 Tax=Fomitiporia mediterranea (strain MF3/22) TaxID=694068 RepID=UPI00044078D7|nr:uncharacterized protein FOMMEDRAFT_154425 [Fomitiporia mediterranea MF3/22]EJD05211.1 hypothetical protein FOMMEDRAFT_154425 [Fomitiporia mediterranea MF3/22]
MLFDEDEYVSATQRRTLGNNPRCPNVAMQIISVLFRVSTSTSFDFLPPLSSYLVSHRTGNEILLQAIGKFTNNVLSSHSDIGSADSDGARLVIFDVASPSFR